MKSGARIKAGRFRALDFIIILVFLSTAALGVTLFWRDLFRALSSQNAAPVGVIVIKKNVVQRRLAERSLWDRLAVESPVYPDDLVRVAELSAATLTIDGSSLDLDENTLIRIDRPPDNRGPALIELREGNMSLATGAEGSGLTLDLFGTQVQAGPGTVLNAAADEKGMVVQVNEGTAQVVQGEGPARELTIGTMIAMDPKGVEREIPGAVVTSPVPNARYLKDDTEPLPLVFTWNRVHLADDEKLRLEIARDRNFTRDIRSFETSENRLETVTDAGFWYWRICLGDEVLSTGRFTVTDASGPELVSPVSDSMYRFQSDLPQLRFQWSAKPEVSYYLLEISETPDFASPLVSREVASVSFIYSSLGPGTWYWRVLPVFFSVYEGTASYSAAASFRIEQSDDPAALAFELPVPAPVPAPVAAAEKAVPGSSYRVRSGDTLRQIAMDAYNNPSRWIEIAEQNNIPNAAVIFPDQVLYIPADGAPEL